MSSFRELYDLKLDEGVRKIVLDEEVVENGCEQTYLFILLEEKTMPVWVHADVFFDQRRKDLAFHRVLYTQFMQRMGWRWSKKTREYVEDGKKSRNAPDAAMCNAACTLLQLIRDATTK